MRRGSQWQDRYAIRKCGFAREGLGLGEGLELNIATGGEMEGKKITVNLGRRPTGGQMKKVGS